MSDYAVSAKRPLQQLIAARALVLDEEPTQQGRDGIFPIMQIISGPPVADAVVAATVFQQYFPSMRTMECYGEGDSGIVFMFDASWPLFILFVHFLLLAMAVRLTKFVHFQFLVCALLDGQFLVDLGFNCGRSLSL